MPGSAKQLDTLVGVFDPSHPENAKRIYVLSVSRHSNAAAIRL